MFVSPVVSTGVGYASLLKYRCLRIRTQINPIAVDRQNLVA